MPFFFFFWHQHDLAGPHKVKSTPNPRASNPCPQIVNPSRSVVEFVHDRVERWETPNDICPSPLLHNCSTFARPAVLREPVPQTLVLKQLLATNLSRQLIRFEPLDETRATPAGSVLPHSGRQNQLALLGRSPTSKLPFRTAS